MNADELAAIRERDRNVTARFRPRYDGGFPEDPDQYPKYRLRAWFDAEHDRRALLAEVDRLTKQLDAVRAMHDGNHWCVTVDGEGLPFGPDTIRSYCPTARALGEA